jgi:hypothetical protein
MSELLVECLFCGRVGFTSRGLRQHFCPSKPPPKTRKKHCAQLTRDEWQRCVDAAKAKVVAA